MGHGQQSPTSWLLSSVWFQYLFIQNKTRRENYYIIDLKFEFLCLIAQFENSTTNVVQKWSYSLCSVSIIPARLKGALYLNFDFSQIIYFIKTTHFSVHFGLRCSQLELLRAKVSQLFQNISLMKYGNKNLSWWLTKPAKNINTHIYLVSCSLRIFFLCLIWPKNQALAAHYWTTWNDTVPAYSLKSWTKLISRNSPNNKNIFFEWLI